MRRCKSAATSSIYGSSYEPKLICLFVFKSEPHNPEMAAKQILSVAPIVEGETENSAFAIPPLNPEQKDSDGKKSE